VAIGHATSIFIVSSTTLLSKYLYADKLISLCVCLRIFRRIRSWSIVALGILRFLTETETSKFVL